MNLNTDKHHSEMPGANEYATMICNGLVAAHQLTPFTSMEDLSGYLHRMHGNPRVQFSTTSDTTMHVTFREKKLITITLS